MNGTVHTAAAEKRLVGGIDDGIDGQARDVVDDDLDNGPTECPCVKSARQPS
jgi:hypothetical protein